MLPVCFENAKKEELAVLERVASRTRWLKEKGKLLFSLTLEPYVGYLSGASTPLGIVAFKVCQLYMTLYTSQVVGTTYGRNGAQKLSIIPFTGFAIGGGSNDQVPNIDLIKYLENQALKLGITSNIYIDPIDPGNSIIRATPSTSFLPYKRIRLTEPLFHPSKFIPGILNHLPDAKARHFVQNITSKAAYGEFLGTRSVVQIAQNTIFKTFGVQTASVLISKLLIDFLSENCRLDSTTLLYALSSGLVIKFCGDLAQAVYSRHLVYSIDKRAVELTGDLQSAVECLHFLEQTTKQTTRLQLLRNCYKEEGVETALAPSYSNRMRALDPEGKFSYTLLDATVEPSDDKKLNYYRNSPEIQFYLKCVAYLKASGALSGSVAVKLIKKLYAWYFSSPLFHFSTLITASAASFYPRELEKLKEHLPEGVTDLFGMRRSFQYPFTPHLQKRVEQIAQEMKIAKEVHVRFYNNCSSPFTATGTRIGPGQALVFVDETTYLGMAPNEQEFLIRHELSHIYNNDTLLGTINYVGALLFMSFLFDWSIGRPDSITGQLTKGALCDLFASILFYLSIRCIEQRADRTAVATCHDNKDEVAAGGAQYLGRLKESQRWSRDQIPFGSLLISESGENRFDLEHPPLEDRIRELTEPSKRR